jgi:peptidoglycan/LPS O-acetylase OafA/YrhL
MRDMTAAFSREHGEFLRTRRFASLDGLRCFSILAVVWHHATGIGMGFLGVEVFFAISGFLITTLLLRERRINGEISLAKFYARRSLRIFPLYYAVLLIYVLLVFTTSRHLPVGREFFHNLPFFASYTSNWFVRLSGETIFYFSWSLATEEQFYLIVPSLEKYCRPFAVPVLILALVLHFASAWIPLGIVAAKISTPLCFGVLGAHALDHQSSFRYVAAVTHSKVWAPAWLLVMLALASISAPEILLATAMTALVVSAAIRPDHGLAWFLNLSPFQSIGQVSYGMYMMHQLCLNLLKKLLPLSPFVLFACGAILTFGVATASYRWYESIFLRLKERYEPDKTGAQSAVNSMALGQ